MKLDSMQGSPRVRISQQVIDVAFSKQVTARVHRTQASKLDVIYGLIGEYCFAEWFFGEWTTHSNVDTRGRIDFLDVIEIKTSAFPFSSALNLLVREDYARVRRPKVYVQTIINTPKAQYSEVEEGLECILAGFAFRDEVDRAPLKDFGAKQGYKGGYQCRFIKISDLHPVDDLRTLIQLS